MHPFGFEHRCFNLYAHDRYIARHGLPGESGDMAGHRFVWIVTHVDLHRTEKVQAMLKCIKADSPPELTC